MTKHRLGTGLILLALLVSVIVAPLDLTTAGYAVTAASLGLLVGVGVWFRRTRA